MVKVTQYIKNVGKSVGFAAVDVLKEFNPAVTDFADSNAELFKEAADTIRNRRVVFKQLQTKVKQSKVYEAADVGIKSLWHSITTGDLYNKANEDALAARMSGLEDFGSVDFDMGDGGESGSWDTGDFGFDIDGDDDDWGSLDNTDEDYEDKPSKGEKLIAEKISGSVAQHSQANAMAISNTVASSAEYIVKSNKITNNMNMLQMMQGFGNLNASIGTLGNNLTGMADRIAQLSQLSADNAKTFYEESLKHQSEISAMLKEMLEMDRERYKSEMQAEKEAEKERIDFSSMTSGGLPNLKEYGKLIKKNAKNAFANSGLDIASMFGDEGNALIGLVSAPLKFLPQAAIKAALGPQIKKSMDNFNKSLSSFFGAMMMNIISSGRIAEESMDGGFKNTIYKNLAKVFGLNNSLTRSFDTSKYERGNMKWNGIAQKTLTDVIPSYLRKILAVIENKPEMVYDYESGKFVNAKEIERSWEDKFTSTARGATSGARDKMVEMSAQHFKFGSKRQEKEYYENMDKFFKFFFDKGLSFEPNRRKFEQYEDMGLDIDEDTYEIFKTLFKNLSTQMQMEFNKNILVAREDLNKSIEAEQTKANSLYNIMGNKSLIDSHLKYDKETGTYDIKSASGIYAQDKYGYNVHDYLKNIFSMLANGIKVYDLASPWSNYRGLASQGSFAPGDDMFNYSKKMSFIVKKEEYKLEREISDNERFLEAQEKAIEKAKSKGKNYKSIDFDDLRNTDNEKHVKFTIQDAIDDAAYDRRVEEARKENEKGLHGLINKAIASRKNDLEKEGFDPEKDTFLSRMTNTQNIYEKLGVINDKIHSLAKLPTKAVVGMIDKADKGLYRIIFGKDDKENKGLLNAIADGVKGTFEKVNTFLDEKIFGPLKKKIDDAGGWKGLFNKVLEPFGLDVDQINVFKRVGDWLLGEKDSEGNRTGGVLTDAISQLKEDSKNVFDFMKEKMSEAFTPIKDWFKDTYEAAKEKIKGKLFKDKSTENGEDEDEESSTSSSSSSSSSTTTSNTINKVNKYANAFDVLEDQMGDAYIEHQDLLHDFEKGRHSENLKNRLNSKSKDLERVLRNKARVEKWKRENPNFNINGAIGIGGDSPLSSLEKIQISIRDSVSAILRIMIGKFSGNASKGIDFRNKFNAGELDEEGMKAYDAWYNSLTASEKAAADAAGIDFPVDMYDEGGFVQKDKVVMIHKGEYVLKPKEYESYKNSKLSKGGTLKIGENEDEESDEQSPSKYKGIKRIGSSTKNLVDAVNNAANNIEEASLIVAGDPEKNKELLKASAKDLTSNFKKHFPKMFSGAVIGGGASLLFSLVGGPLVGAGVGAAIGLARSSKAFSSFLFGEEVTEDVFENGEKVGTQKVRKGGLLTQKQQEIIQNIKKRSGLIGLGAIAGFLGGPLVGAGIGTTGNIVLGSALGYALGSEKTKRFLFGYQDEETNEWKEGLFKKEFQKKFKERGVAIGAGGAAGILLRGFSGPFGIVGNAVMGSAIGYATQTEGFKRFFFGEVDQTDGKRKGGIYDKVIKKHAKALGIGAGAGVLLGGFSGPFGVLGNAVIGSALGLAADTKAFKRIMFGVEKEVEVEDENGNLIKKKVRDGGILGTLKGVLWDSIGKPFGGWIKKSGKNIGEWFKESIAAPVKGAIKPFFVEAKHILREVFSNFGIGLKEHVIFPVKEFLEGALIKPARKALGFTFGVLGKVLGPTLSAPFKMIGGGGRGLMAKHIKEGDTAEYSDDEIFNFLKNDKNDRFFNTGEREALLARQMANIQSKPITDSLKDQTQILNETLRSIYREILKFEGKDLPDNFKDLTTEELRKRLADPNLSAQEKAIIEKRLGQSERGLKDKSDYKAIGKSRAIFNQLKTSAIAGIGLSPFLLPILGSLGNKAMGVAGMAGQGAMSVASLLNPFNLPGNIAKVGGAIGGLAGAGANAIGPVLGSVMNAIGGFLGSPQEVLLKAGYGIAAYLGLKSLKGMKRAIFGGKKKTRVFNPSTGKYETQEIETKGIIGTIRETAINYLFNPVRDRFAKMRDGIKNWIDEKLFTPIKDTFKTIGNEIKHQFGKFFNWIKNGLFGIGKKIFGGIANKAKGVGNKVRGKFYTLKGRLMAKKGNSMDDFYNQLYGEDEWSNIQNEEINDGEISYSDAYDDMVNGDGSLMEQYMSQQRSKGKKFAAENKGLGKVSSWLRGMKRDQMLGDYGNWSPEDIQKFLNDKKNASLLSEDQRKQLLSKIPGGQQISATEEAATKITDQVQSTGNKIVDAINNFAKAVTGKDLSGYIDETNSKKVGGSISNIATYEDGELPEDMLPIGPSNSIGNVNKALSSSNKAISQDAKMVQAVNEAVKNTTGQDNTPKGMLTDYGWAPLEESASGKTSELDFQNTNAYRQHMADKEEEKQYRKGFFGNLKSFFVGDKEEEKDSGIGGIFGKILNSLLTNPKILGIGALLLTMSGGIGNVGNILGNIWESLTNFIKNGFSNPESRKDKDGNIIPDSNIEEQAVVSTGTFFGKVVAKMGDKLNNASVGLSNIDKSIRLKDIAKEYGLKATDDLAEYIYKNGGNIDDAMVAASKSGSKYYDDLAKITEKINKNKPGMLKNLLSTLGKYVDDFICKIPGVKSIKSFFSRLAEGVAKCSKTLSKVTSKWGSVLKTAGKSIAAAINVIDILCAITTSETANVFQVNKDNVNFGMKATVLFMKIIDMIFALITYGIGPLLREFLNEASIAIFGYDFQKAAVQQVYKIVSDDKTLESLQNAFMKEYEKYKADNDLPNLSFDAYNDLMNKKVYDILKKNWEEHGAFWGTLFTVKDVVVDEAGSMLKHIVKNAAAIPGAIGAVSYANEMSRQALNASSVTPVLTKMIKNDRETYDKMFKDYENAKSSKNYNQSFFDYAANEFGGPFGSLKDSDYGKLYSRYFAYQYNQQQKTGYTGPDLTEEELSAAGYGSFYNAQNKNIANIRYNNPNDTVRQTLGDSGCAPLAAASYIRYMTNKHVDPKEAAMYAIAKGYKDKDGGTQLAYFSDYLATQGINTQAVNMDDNTRTLVTKRLRTGVPVVLLGKSDEEGPYTEGGHYIVATKAMGNKVVVDDPMEKQLKSYSLEEVLSKAEYSVLPVTKSDNLPKKSLYSVEAEAEKEIQKKQEENKNKSIFSKFFSFVSKVFNKDSDSNLNSTVTNSIPKFKSTAYQDLSAYKSTTAESLNEFIKAYGRKGSPFNGRGDVFIQAAKESGLDPRYILAHAALESGWGTSEICKKKGNYFGIGAFNTSPMASAYTFKPDDMALSIIEGAKWIRRNYFDRGQKNLYDMIYKEPYHRYAVYDGGKPNDGWVKSISTIMSNASGYGDGPETTTTEDDSINNGETYQLSEGKTATDFLSDITSLLGGLGKEILGITFNPSESESNSESDSITGSASNTNKQSASNYFLSVPGFTAKTSNFGPRILNGKPDNHRGIDYGAPNTTKIPTPVDGTVYTVSTESNRTTHWSYGNNVVIRDSKGRYHYFAHMLNKPPVKKGDHVKADQFIGVVGNTGESYGNHLHYEIRDTDNRTPLNPDTYLTEYWKENDHTYNNNKSRNTVVGDWALNIMNPFTNPTKNSLPPKLQNSVFGQQIGGGIGPNSSKININNDSKILETSRKNNMNMSRAHGVSTTNSMNQLISKLADILLKVVENTASITDIVEILRVGLKLELSEDQLAQIKNNKDSKSEALKMLKNSILNAGGSQGLHDNLMSLARQ